MPLQNRVTPMGELVGDPARGRVFGNRGNLHDDAGNIVRRHRGNLWIACQLRFKDRHRDPMPPGAYTGLFFLDDATALAAGHRPCGECRHRDYQAFTDRWPEPLPTSGRSQAMDRRLHEERVQRNGERRLHEAAIDDLPDGAFVLRDDAAWLVLGDRLLRWSAAGYHESLARPSGEPAVLITPPATVAVLRAGWRPEAVPFLHESATPSAAEPASRQVAG